jgi:HPt (histidine-containing phosphotransfer) domain-containing protein
MLDNLNEDLDLSFLHEIADGSNEFIVESIDMFLQQTPELLQNIANAIAANDWVTAGAAAHKLKPNLGFFGMLECQAVIQNFELGAKAGGNEPEVLTEQFNQVRAAIEANSIKLTQVKNEAAAQL